MFKRPAANPELTDAIDTALRELKGHDAHSDEYRNIVNQITALHAIQDKTKDRVSKDTLVMVLGNLAGIILIVNHEQLAVVTSKALPFVGKFRTM